jgi:hypothetical protein
MVTAVKSMNNKKFAAKTTMLTALQALECSPYGNIANRVDTAPVPVGYM